MCVWYLDKLNLIRHKPIFSTAPAVASKNKTEFKIRQKLLENNQLHLLVLIHGTFCIYVKIHTIYFFLQILLQLTKIPTFRNSLQY